LEVDKGDPRIGTNKNVSESDISVNNAPLMQLLESLNDAILQNHGHRGRSFHPEYRMRQIHRDINLARARIDAYNVRDNVPLQWKKIS
jgi:hypothetical protein